MCFLNSEIQFENSLVWIWSLDQTLIKHFNLTSIIFLKWLSFWNVHFNFLSNLNFAFLSRNLCIAFVLFATVVYFDTLQTNEITNIVGIARSTSFSLSYFESAIFHYQFFFQLVLCLAIRLFNRIESQTQVSTIRG